MKNGTSFPTRSQRILVADDNRSIGLIISSILTGDGFIAKVFADGEEAWNELHRESYDLLVTDQDMPRLTGLNLIARMRQAGMNIPAMLVSGSLSGETTRNYPQLKISEVISKPFDPWNFLKLVRSSLGIAVASLPSGTSAYANSHAPRLQHRNRPVQPLHNHVLIADDDAVVRASLAAVLQSEGYEVDEASNGIEAVTRAIKHKPDLILLDLNMPHADGWTAFSQLDQFNPLLPVIIITARPNQYPEAVRVGVDAFMEKPLDIPILINAVKRLTNEDEQHHEHRITQRTFVTQLLGHASA
jgi:CheY-like chemotaxis protein